MRSYIFYFFEFSFKRSDGKLAYKARLPEVMTQIDDLNLISFHYRLDKFYLHFHNKFVFVKFM